MIIDYLNFLKKNFLCPLSMFGVSVITNENWMKTLINICRMKAGVQGL